MTVGALVAARTTSQCPSPATVTVTVNGPEERTLTDIEIKAATLRKSAYELADRDGLYLLVSPTGGRWWRYDYRHLGKRKTISLGVYPDVKLAAKRDRLRDARTHVAAGRDPVARLQDRDAPATHGGAEHV